MVVELLVLLLLLVCVCKCVLLMRLLLVVMMVVVAVVFLMVGGICVHFSVIFSYSGVVDVLLGVFDGGVCVGIGVASGGGDVLLEAFFFFLLFVSVYNGFFCLAVLLSEVFVMEMPLLL